GRGFKSRRSDHKIKDLGRSRFPENGIGKHMGIDEKYFCARCRCFVKRAAQSRTGRRPTWLGAGLPFISTERDDAPCNRGRTMDDYRASEASRCVERENWWKGG